MDKFIKNITERNLVDAKKTIQVTLYQKMAEKIAHKKVEIAKNIEKGS